MGVGPPAPRAPGTYAGRDATSGRGVGELMRPVCQAPRRARIRNMRFVLRSAITALAVWLLTLMTWFGVGVEGGESDWWKRLLVFLAIGILIEGLNSIVRPILTFLSLPLLILTLGLFSLIISWAILWLAHWVTTWIAGGIELTLGGFWQTFWAALVLAITTAILTALIPGAGRSESLQR